MAGKISELLDKLVSEEGLKTDLTIRFSNSQMINIFLVLLLATLIANVLGTVIKTKLLKS